MSAINTSESPTGELPPPPPPKTESLEDLTSLELMRKDLNGDITDDDADSDDNVVILDPDWEQVKAIYAERPPPPPEPVFTPVSTLPTPPVPPPRSPRRPLLAKASDANVGRRGRLRSVASFTSIYNAYLAPAKKPKLHHALLELLSSERTYMMDLDLLRGLYIPLAVGHKPTLTVLGSRLGAKSKSSSPTPPPLEHLGLDLNSREACMTSSDVRTVFSNVEVLWGLSERFGRRLESALQRIRDLDLSSVPPLSPPSDHQHLELDEKETIADILLDMIPTLEAPYTYYITRHPRALERWTHLSTPPPDPALLREKEEKESKKKKDKDDHITPSTSLNPYARHSTSADPAIMTPFRKYLSTTASLMQAYQLTNAWDVPSLLIKPVQRLLKYGLLIHAIIDAATNSDAPLSSSEADVTAQTEMEKLRRAKRAVDEIARRVNERKRRLEVVRGALDNKIGAKNPLEGSEVIPSSSSLIVNLNPAVGLGRLKSVKIPIPTEGSDAESIEAYDLQNLQKRLKQALSLIESFEQGVLSTLQRTRGGNAALGKWARAFGRVIAFNVNFGVENPGHEEVAPAHGSEALSAFEEICRVSVAVPDHTSRKSDHIVSSPNGRPISADVTRINGSNTNLNDPEPDSSTLNSSPSLNTHWQGLEAQAKHLLLLLDTLKQTAVGPTKIFKSLNTLHLSHKTLLNIPYSKSRPPSSLVSASQAYLALASAVREEVPAFLALLEKGVGKVIIYWAKAQEEYWRGVRDVWLNLWSALGMVDVKPETFGAEECIRIWWERFEEIERFLSERQLLNRRWTYPHSSSSSSSVFTTVSRHQSSNSHHSYRSHQSQQSQGSIRSHHSYGPYASPPHSSPPITQVPGSQPASYGFSNIAASFGSNGIGASPSAQRRRQYTNPDVMNRSNSQTSSSNFYHRADSQHTANTMTTSTTRTSTTTISSASYQSSPPNDSLWDYTVFEQGLQIASGENSGDVGVVGDFDEFASSPKTLKSSSSGTLLAPPPYSPRHSPSFSESFQRSHTPNPLQRTRSQSHTEHTGRVRTFSQSSDPSHSGGPPPDLYAHSPPDSSSPPNSNNGRHHRLSEPDTSPISPLSETLYTCTTVHPFIPPADAYAPSAIPFLTLQVGDTVQILQELGSPSQYEGFASVIEDDGRDCLLIARDELGVVGWVLASFLVPLE